jgi:hypothetical protein
MGFLVIIFINISTHEYGSFVLERMQDRLSFSSTDDLSGGSRGSQIEVVMSACNDFVFGDGLGSRGGAARAAYLPGITDNDWIRILVELGGVGMILFIVVYGMTIYKAFKKKSFMMAELTIVLYGLLSMLVADTMYKGDLVLIFWFAIGRIWNQNLYLKRIKENNCI